MTLHVILSEHVEFFSLHLIYIAAQKDSRTHQKATNKIFVGSSYHRADKIENDEREREEGERFR